MRADELTIKNLLFLKTNRLSSNVSVNEFVENVLNKKKKLILRIKFELLLIKNKSVTWRTDEVGKFITNLK
jgi:hypothetical protein